MFERFCMRVLTGLEEIRAAVGEHLGYSDYQVVTQEDIDAFAALTGDDQWIHTDPERAANGPFGTTIAHGLLTLSLGPRHAKSIYRLDGMAMSVNYGYDKIRFPSPVPVNSKIRVGATISSVTDVPGGAQVGITFVWEVAGNAKPACVAEMLIRALAVNTYMTGAAINVDGGSDF
jgi:acyl dehydratase